TPQRLTCTDVLGSALTTSFGRLDGYLVSIVPPGHHGCNGDSSHIHLQVRASGSTYDLAVTIAPTLTPATPTVSFAGKDGSLTGVGWQEGWNTNVELDYAQTLGLHSGDFMSLTPADLTQALNDRLATVNHISVYATGYGPTGAHLVHRNSSAHDGAI